MLCCDGFNEFADFAETITDSLTWVVSRDASASKKFFFGKNNKGIRDAGSTADIRMLLVLLALLALLAILSLLSLLALLALLALLVLLALLALLSLLSLLALLAVGIEWNVKVVVSGGGLHSPPPLGGGEWSPYGGNKGERGFAPAPSVVGQPASQLAS